MAHLNAISIISDSYSLLLVEFLSILQSNFLSSILANFDIAYTNLGQSKKLLALNYDATSR